MNTIKNRTIFDDYIDYQLLENKAITRYSRNVLRNGGDDWEETLLRDPMTQSLVNGMMKCGYMAYAPSALFLNGEYWGIHNIREKFGLNGRKTIEKNFDWSRVGYEYYKTIFDC